MSKGPKRIETDAPIQAPAWARPSAATEAVVEEPEELLPEEGDGGHTVETLDPMADAPDDGRIILLRSADPDDRVKFPARWKKTRYFRNGKWNPTGKWVSAVSGVDITFAPAGWEPYITEVPAAIVVPEASLSPEQERRMRAMGRVR